MTSVYNSFVLLKVLNNELSKINVFTECDNCNESDFATKLLTSDIHKFQFLHLLVKITLNFISVGLESGAGIASALMYDFVQVH